MGLNKIFVIFDPTTESQPAFQRALQSAHMTGTRLHIYACLASPVEAADVQPRLDELAHRCRDQYVEAELEVEVAPDWSEQAVRAAARCSASLVFKSSFEHSNVDREKRPTSDFTLLRMSPCPVLLVKDKHDWSSRRVLAAIDSQASDDAHGRLNNLIISLTQNFTDAYGSDAHFVTVYADANHPPDLAALSARCGAPQELVHVRKGAAAQEIAAAAEELNVDLVIIGTVGRSGIKGKVVGNTAEKILDHTAADVLVVN